MPVFDEEWLAHFGVNPDALLLTTDKTMQALGPEGRLYPDPMRISINGGIPVMIANREDWAKNGRPRELRRLWVRYQHLHE